MKKSMRFDPKAGLAHVTMLLVLVAAVPCFAQDDPFFFDEGPLDIFGIKAVGTTALDECENIIRLSVFYRMAKGVWPGEHSDLEGFLKTEDAGDLKDSEAFDGFEHLKLEQGKPLVLVVHFELKTTEREQLKLNHLKGEFEISLIDGTHTGSSVKVAGEMKIETAEGEWQGNEFESDQLGKTSFIREIKLK